MIKMTRQQAAEILRSENLKQLDPKLVKMAMQVVVGGSLQAPEQPEMGLVRFAPKSEGVGSPKPAETRPKAFKRILDLFKREK